MLAASTDLKAFTKDPKGQIIENPVHKTKPDLEKHRAEKEKDKIIAATEAGHDAIRNKKTAIDKKERDYVIEGNAADDVGAGEKPFTQRQLANSRRTVNKSYNLEKFADSRKGLHGAELPTFAAASKTLEVPESNPTDFHEQERVDTDTSAVVEWWK